jgi:hypothetical protein
MNKPSYDSVYADHDSRVLVDAEPFVYCRIRPDGEKEFCSEAEFAKPEDGWFSLDRRPPKNADGQAGQEGEYVPLTAGQKQALTRAHLASARVVAPAPDEALVNLDPQDVRTAYVYMKERNFPDIAACRVIQQAYAALTAKGGKI